VKYGRFWLWNIIFSILLAVITFILFTYISPTKFENFGKCSSNNYKKLGTINETRRFNVANFENPFIDEKPLDKSDGYNCNVSGVSLNNNISKSCRGATLNNVINGTSTSSCCPQYTTGRGNLNPVRGNIEKEFGSGRPDLYSYETLKESCPRLKYQEPPPQYYLNPATPFTTRENFELNPTIIDTDTDIDRKNVNMPTNGHKLVKLLTKELCKWCDKAKNQLYENKNTDFYNNLEIIVLHQNDQRPVPVYTMDDKIIQTGFNENFEELCEKFNGILIEKSNVNLIESFKQQKELFTEQTSEYPEIHRNVQSESDVHYNSQSEVYLNKCGGGVCKINVSNEPLNNLKGNSRCNNYLNISDYLDPTENIMFSMAGSTINLNNPDGYFCKNPADCGSGNIFTN